MFETSYYYQTFQMGESGEIIEEESSHEVLL